ncbi:ribonuclease III [Paraclostridium sordellii]|uniref:Ribonuclease 3 n=1 Tax=Paraclostridium sordellii TaxID=1505 RepID=A0A0C7Q949_PARSO|nr:ribonuclease III [Paeniclostridium sordellii]QYE97438.1 ribonuclease III [Paeniclostridium sordellii]CEN79925.1 ribonuclease III [[Clostridium] sordellii] [Paeniclostridium sordellii]CEO12810.1 ribonuclease III [[Clostridium] sordellii] [Paeniclostridium sordellii]CEP87972.1 ribonuclease III [[Clostridium] sordellii] [Paeniclostridium sordellii]CEP97292.1 ribonuclease III [[Clostridium] sordellii] [Paeniclostridium sordellii]
MKIKSSILNNISKFEEIINYKFVNKAYILEALTHSSYSNENKSYAFNERLEFLGDSVLGIVVSDFLFKNETELPEGELTKLRANIVCEESLSDVAKNLNLGKHILLGRGEEATGGRDRVSILADAFEAVIAAIYLDGGIEPAKTFVLKNMEEIIEDSIKGRIFRDYKTHLQEVVQSQGESNIVYNLVEEIGPDHNKRFVMEVRLNDESLGKGEGKSKKEAEQSAAKQALRRMI